MKQPRINRRQFFKLSAFGAGTVAAASLVSVAATPSHEALAAVNEPHTLALPQPTFNPIASMLPSGNPPTDIAAGWDGTLWAIDASGSPHVYDPTQDTWQAHGDPLSGACWIGTTYYWFKKVEATVDHSDAGIEVATAPFGGAVSVPQPLSALFPDAPDSFKLSLVGAANVAGTLIVFNGGRYAPADGSAAAVALNTLANWPKTADWADGVIDAVHSDGTASVMLFSGAQFVFANLVSKTVTSGPSPISSYAPWQNRLPASWATTGIDAAFTTGVTVTVYKGTQVIAFDVSGSGIATAQYIPTINAASWPATWHPILNHAPQGRMNNLWVATKSGGVVQHDGANWNTKDNAGNGATNVAVGQDDSVFLCGTGSQVLWQWSGTQWQNIATSAVTLSQVAAGNSSEVFLRGTDNSVQQLDPNNALSAVNLGANVPAPTHLAANADGTLWHCTSGNPNTFRFITEATTVPSAQLPVKGSGIVSGVSKVASTGYGAAHCLATHSDGSTVLYRHDSPFVFKSPDPVQPTGPLVPGLGQLFFVQIGGAFGIVTSNVVAVDAQTGKVVATSPTLTTPTTSNPLRHTSPVFDPINELVYVGVYVGGDDASAAYDQTTPGQVLALDARTLQVRWKYETTTSVDAIPTLSGTQLYFGDRLANVYMFNTRTALSDVSQIKDPTPVWKVATGFAGGRTERVSSPIVSDGRMYATVWDVVTTYNGKLTNVVGIFQCDTSTGQNSSANVLWENPDVDVDNLTFPPVIATLTAGTGQTAAGRVIWMSIYGGILGWGLDATLPFLGIFAMPSGSGIASPFTYDDGTRLGTGLPGPNRSSKPPSLWFGDNRGNLWGVDMQGSFASGGLLKALPYTPNYVQASQPNQYITIATAPVLYKDAQGGMTVLFGAPDPGPEVLPNGYLYGFDPDNGNTASLITGTTQITSLAPAAVNGVVYAGGNPISTDAPPSQLFAIRVDETIQALRDFIIEGEMMQDPDPNATGGDPANSIPPSVARYHTHLTVVDDQKNPMAYEAVKIWADSPDTAITVDGQTFTIGPDDASYALVKTAADGVIVLTLDAVDYFAPTLRVWASFMDPYERIVVNPDTTFHQRISSAYSDPNSSTAQDDPTRVNLNNRTNYNGKPLFTDDEKNADPPAPKNVADSVQQAGTGLGLNSSSSKALFRKMMHAMGLKHKNQRVKVTILEAAVPPEKYMAYADLPSATHFPTNIPAQRLATIAQPIGLSFSRPNGDLSQAPVFNALSHIEARAQIDALQGEAWKPTDPIGNGTPDFRPVRTFNIFTDFWNWLKKVFDKIAQCLLSIVEDVLAAIQYVVDGLLKVFKAILKVLADIFPFLGSFFKMLEKLIDDVIAALSILFEFGEIIWTHKWLAGQFQSRIDDVTNAITAKIQPAVDGFFENAEEKIKTVFDNLRAEFASGGNPQLNSTKGVGQTPHTAFNVGPRNGSPSSHATQCTWGTQKLKSGLPSASANGSLNRNTIKPTEASTPSADPVSGFFHSFVDSLSSDPVLSSAVSQLKSDFGNLFHASSIKQFFSTLMATLLDIVETLLIGALAVVNALVDGLLAVINDAIQAVISILTTEIEIPVLTWLYEKLFGEPLTFLNVATLVAAIPVTVIFRIVEGKFPSQASLPTVSAMQANRALAASPLVQEILGIFVAVFQLVQGIANAVGDGAGDDAPAVAGYVSLGCGLMIEAFTFPLIANDSADVSSSDWGVYGVSIVITLSGLAGVSYTGADDQPTSPLPTPVASILTLILNLGAMAAAIVAYVEDGKSDGISNAAFAEEIISSVVGMLNPIKLLGGEAAGLVAAADALGGIALLFISIVLAIEANASAVLREKHRLFFPWVVYSPQPRSAHP